MTLLQAFSAGFCACGALTLFVLFPHPGESVDALRQRFHRVAAETAALTRAGEIIVEALWSPNVAAPTMFGGEQPRGQA